MSWQQIGLIGSVKSAELSALTAHVEDLRAAVKSAPNAQDLSASIAQTVKAAVDGLPRADVDAELLRREIAAAVDGAEERLLAKAVAAMPAPKQGSDGVGVVGALIDQRGELVLTLSNGETKSVGCVVGKSVDPNDVAVLVKSALAEWPRPKDGEKGQDGKDGLGFDDLDVAFDDRKGWLLTFVSGTQRKALPLGIPFDAGVWESGRLYPKGAGVTVKGAWWIAQETTSARPGDETPESRKWRLSVKSGRDGKPGRDGKDGLS